MLPIDSTTHSLSSVNALIAKRDISSLLKDEKNFWLLFCKALEGSKTHGSDGWFRVSVAGDELKSDDKVKHNIGVFVDEIRKKLLKCFEEKKNVDLILYSFGSNTSLHENQTLIIHTKPLAIGNALYDHCIQNTFGKLAEFLGADSQFSKEKKLTQYKTVGCEFSPTTSEVDRIQFLWKKEACSLYTIPPQIIPPRPDFSKGLYSLYQNQQLCDFSIANQGKEIKLHSTVLFLNGGEVFQTMLSDTTGAKSVSMDQFSPAVISAFVDFLYLGEKAFVDTLASSQLNVFELFRFASIYHIKELIDCSTNLIDLLVKSPTEEELKMMEVLGKQFENTHLLKICDHFQKASLSDLLIS